VQLVTVLVAHRALEVISAQCSADPLEAKDLRERDRSGVARVHLCHNQDARYLPEWVKGAFCEIRQFGKLGAPRLPLAREGGVDYMINEVIVEPLSLALNALSPETQPLGYGTAPSIVGRTRDANSVQFELHKGVIDQCPARSGHEPMALELLPKPVTQRGGAVLPVYRVVAALHLKSP
jgi:hypothetical protein